MQNAKVITKCCICGRERDGEYGGWHYRIEAPEAEARYSHGFCNVCYETEIMKLKLRNLVCAVPAETADCRI